MAKGQGNQQQQKKKAALLVTPGDVKSIGDKFEVEFEVITTDEDEKPAAAIVTMKKDIEKGVTKTTESATGQPKDPFKYVIEMDKAAGKTYNMRFIRTDPNIVISVPIAFPEDKISTPATKSVSWEVKPHGTDGKYYLTVQVMDKKNVKHMYDLWLFEILSGAMITILSGNPMEPQTDENGFLAIKLTDFNEEKRAIHLRIKGTGLDQVVYLDGPQLQKCPRCKSFRWDGIKCLNCNYPKNTIIR